MSWKVRISETEDAIKEREAEREKIKAAKRTMKYEEEESLFGGSSSSPKVGNGDQDDSASSGPESDGSASLLPVVPAKNAEDAIKACTTVGLGWGSNVDMVMKKKSKKSSSTVKHSHNGEARTEHLIRLHDVINNALEELVVTDDNLTYEYVTGAVQKLWPSAKIKNYYFNSSIGDNMHLTEETMSSFKDSCKFENKRFTYELNFQAYPSIDLSNVPVFFIEFSCNGKVSISKNYPIEDLSAPTVIRFIKHYFPPGAENSGHIVFKNSAGKRVICTKTTFIDCVNCSKIKKDKKTGKRLQISLKFTNKVK